MKNYYIIALALIGVSFGAQAQVDEKVPDTTRMNVGSTEIIFIDHDHDEDSYVIEDGDTIYPHRRKRSEAHWAGIDFGFSMLMNGNFENNFNNYPYWNNDAAKSVTWNVNFAEHKFQVARHIFGITTGLGFSFTSIGFKDNYVIGETADTLLATIDTVNIYSKNKLKAAYLTVPLLLEFNSNPRASKSFYFATGVVGGVRLASKIKRKGEFDGKEFVQKEKGKYGLNPFKLDAVARIGYSDFGAFASYSLLPLFDTNKTTVVYPLTFGLSFNF